MSIPGRKKRSALTARNVLKVWGYGAAVVVLVMVSFFSCPEGPRR